jgi:hypothetical protein
MSFVIYKAQDSHTNECEYSHRASSKWCPDFFFLLLFIYSHVHTLFGSFLPTAPGSHPLSPTPLASRQNPLCPYL